VDWQVALAIGFPSAGKSGRIKTRSRPTLTTSDPSNPKQSSGWGYRGFVFLLTNPITRLVLGFVLIGMAATALQNLLQPLRFAKNDPLELRPLAMHWLASLLFCSALVGAYAVFVRVFEKRWPGEFRPSGLWSWFPLGFAIGAGLITASALLIRFGGWAVVERVQPSSEWAGLVALSLGTQLAVAFIEEVLVRGLLFRLIEECLGSWWALAISAVLFGLAHLSNDNATWFAALGLGLQAGGLLGAAYLLSRSLWLPIGIHWAWNGIQGGVFGGALSGNTVRAIYTTSPWVPNTFPGGNSDWKGRSFPRSCARLWGLVFVLLRFKPGGSRAASGHETAPKIPSPS